MLGLTLREEFCGKHYKGTPRHTGSLVLDEKTTYRLTQQGRLLGFEVAGTWIPAAGYPRVDRPAKKIELSRCP